MAYNNYFPIGYTPYYPQQQSQPTVTQNNSSIIWVQGEAGAKSYLVSPNTTVQLWDSESQTIYLKSADASGMPSMKVLDYTIRSEPQNGHSAPSNVPIQGKISREDLDALQRQIDALKDEMRAYRATASIVEGKELKHNVEPDL